MADIARLTALIEPEAAALGFELVRVAMLPSEAGDGGMALQIMAEDPATGQLVIDQCAALSRRVSDVIDAYEKYYRLRVEEPQREYDLNVALARLGFVLGDFNLYLGWVHDGKVSL